MRVGVDEAGKHGVGGEIGDGNAGRGGVGDGLDAVAGDEDVGVRANVAGAHVDEFAGEDGLRDGRLLSFLGRDVVVGAEDDNCGQKKGS